MAEVIRQSTGRKWRHSTICDPNVGDVNTFGSLNAAVKRVMQEMKEMREPTEHYFAAPMEVRLLQIEFGIIAQDNIFEWHFTVRGPPDSEFEGGLYHGRITLPPEYPMKPPAIMLLTVTMFHRNAYLLRQPNGRFETNTKICLSVSSYHPESWQPSWSSNERTAATWD